MIKYQQLPYKEKLCAHHVPLVTGVQPMFQVFQQYPGVLESDEARKIIRSYNKVAKVLLEYEVIYHQAWLKQVRSSDCLIIINLFFLILVFRGDLSLLRDLECI